MSNMVTIKRDMIPAWQNALVGRWDDQGTGCGARSLSRGAAHCDYLIAEAVQVLAQDPEAPSVSYEREHLLARLGDQDGEDCWTALTELRGAADQLQRLALRAGL